MTPRLKDLAPWMPLFAPYRTAIAGGLALSALTLLGALGLVGFSGGFLAAAAAAALVPGGVQAFDILVPAGVIRVFALTRTVGRWAERVVNHEVTFRVLGSLRGTLYRRLSRLSPRQHGLWHGAEVLNRLVRDVDLLDNLFVRFLVPWGAAVLVSGVCAAWAWSLGTGAGWAASALALAGLGFAPAVFYAAGKRLAPGAVESHERLRRTLLDTVEGLDDLVLHRPAWDAQTTRVRAEDERRFRLQNSLLRWGASGRALTGILAAAAAFAVFAAAAGSPAGPQAPWTAALVLVLLGSTETLGALIPASLDLSGTAQAGARLTALSGQEPRPRFPDAMDGPTGLDLRFEAVSFAYDPEVPVLNGVDLQLPFGTHVALVGPSGGGKSTLLSLITRLEDPTAGRVLLGGRPLASYTEPALRDRVGGSLQDAWAFSGTLADNLRAASPADEAALWRALETVGLAAQVRAWPEGLGTWVEEGGQSLSGGQRKRLALARTLLRATAVTVLDEPTEGLKPSEALELVAEVRKALAGRTLIWATHRPEGLSGFSQIWRLTGGRLSVERPE